MQCWVGLTRQQWQGVLSGTIPHTIEGETVIINFGGEEAPHVRFDGDDQGGYYPAA